jgi:midasin
LDFCHAFNDRFASAGLKITLRDLLSWLDFIQRTCPSSLTPEQAYVHGAALAILDGVGLGSTQSLHAASEARNTALALLAHSLRSCSLQKNDDDDDDDEHAENHRRACVLGPCMALHDMLTNVTWQDHGATCGIPPFFLPKGPHPLPQDSKLPFSLAAPTTMTNVMRVLRALQVPRPILLEGSPGVGKTSLVHALAQLAGHTLVRINLSEQTDVADLFGSDLPSANSDLDTPFAWCDGVFLRALKAGHWVLLDELNLASQSVLEGLNACLDHRGTVYIPEIDRTFACPSTFRVFAAQNPLRQGGGRKGLPKSFLNRFTRVVVDSLNDTDLRVIATTVFPSLSSMDIHRMIDFNAAIHDAAMVQRSFGREGAPWEFNLRDVFRWCTLVETRQPRHDQNVDVFIPLLYLSRFRTAADRQHVCRQWAITFDKTRPFVDTAPVLQVTPQYVQIGTAVLPRRHSYHHLHPQPQPQEPPLSLDAFDNAYDLELPPLLNQYLKPMEHLMHCVLLKWPALLVGPSGSGKTSMVRILASLTGHTLHELGLSTGTDATELLGCFEQVDLLSRVENVLAQLTVLARHVQQLLLLQCHPTLCQPIAHAMAAVIERKRHWYQIYTNYENKETSA